MQIDQLEQLEKNTFRLVDSTLVLNDDCLDFLQQLRAEKSDVTSSKYAPKHRK